MSDNISLRLSKELKKEFNIYCKERGLTVSTATKIFVKNFINSSFKYNQLIIDSKYHILKNDTHINIYIDKQTKKDFYKYCHTYGLPISIVLRNFMNYCIMNNEFPI